MKKYIVSLMALICLVTFTVTATTKTNVGTTKNESNAIQSRSVTVKKIHVTNISVATRTYSGTFDDDKMTVTFNGNTLNVQRNYYKDYGVDKHGRHLYDWIAGSEYFFN